MSKEVKKKSKYIKFIYFIFAVSALIYSLSYAYEQYLGRKYVLLEDRNYNLEVKKHNLNVISQIRLCLVNNFKEGTFQACAERVKDEYIGGYKKKGGHYIFE